MDDDDAFEPASIAGKWSSVAAGSTPDVKHPDLVERRRPPPSSSGSKVGGGAAAAVAAHAGGGSVNDMLDALTSLELDALAADVRAAQAVSYTHLTLPTILLV